MSFIIRKLLRAAALCALLLTTLLSPVPAVDFAEYRVKAEFLERIAEFVEWPAGAFSGPEAPFVITIAGTDPFGHYLEDLARTRTIKGRAVVLHHVEPGDPLGACHLLFIANSEHRRLDEILASAAGRAVLIIGDGKRFAEKGAHVAVYRKEGRLRFELNLEASRRSGLIFSSKLMPLAAAVYGKEGP